MEALFTSLTLAVTASLPIALAAAFAWGILSILLSPCHLSSIPLIVSYLATGGDLQRRRALGVSLAFGGGILLSTALVGLLTAAAGRLAGDVGRSGNLLLALIFLLVGLYLVGWLPLPWQGADLSRIRGRGAGPALLLGLIFGVAVGPCTFAYMAPVLGVVFSTSAEDFPRATAMILAYALGSTAVIVAAGLSTATIQRYLNWNERSQGLTILRAVCGTLVALGGVYLAWRTLAP
jgi:cytochrome c-type biogenesis protein